MVGSLAAALTDFLVPGEGAGSTIARVGLTIGISGAALYAGHWAYNIWRYPLAARDKQRERSKALAEANKRLVVELADLKGRPNVGRVQGIFNRLIFWGWQLDQEIEHERLQFPDKAIWRWVAAVDCGMICLIDARFLGEHIAQLSFTTDRKHLVARMALLREFTDNLQLQQLQKRPKYEEMEEVIEDLKGFGDVLNPELPSERASPLLLDQEGQ